MKYIGLLLGIFGFSLSFYSLTEEKHIIFNCFLIALNVCYSVFWIKEIVNEKLRK